MSKGLMRKTKQELVDIILRKDDVESQLQKQLKVCQDEFVQIKTINNKYCFEIDKRDKDFQLLNKDYITLKENNTELAKTLAEKEEVISGLEDLVEENQLNLTMMTKRNNFYYRWAVVATMIVLGELFILLELMF